MPATHLALFIKERKLPNDILQDIEKIKSILLNYGALKIILYGSLARGNYRTDSDIDICVEGISDNNYFRAVAECLMKTERRVSILDFQNTRGYFRERILEEGKVIYERDRVKE